MASEQTEARTAARVDTSREAVERFILRLRSWRHIEGFHEAPELVRALLDEQHTLRVRLELKEECSLCDEPVAMRLCVEHHIEMLASKLEDSQ